MTTNGRRLDRVEEAFRSGAPWMPSSWEVQAEIERMEANPGQVSRWSHEQVQVWIEEATSE
jgi:hypothetical protein